MLPRKSILATGAFTLAGAMLLVRAAMRSSRRHPRMRSSDDDDRSRCDSPAVPTWLKLGYSVATPVIAAVYWHAYGPKNFLWLSDIALASTTLGAVGENRLLVSMPAAGALPLETAWNIDVLSGGRVLGLAAYMFDPQRPLGLRALSLFHVALPPTLLWLLARLGYDRRALSYQTILTWAVLPLTYALTRPEDNVNWVFGPGREPQRAIPPLLYLGLEMVVLPALVFLPTHLILERVFGTGIIPARTMRRDPVRRSDPRRRINREGTESAPMD